MEFLYTAKFLRSLKKLPHEIQSDVFMAVKAFVDKENHKQLSLHKLHGTMKKYYAFSANFQYRIILKIEKKTIYFMDVGTHEMYV